jgi:hypothetical protein
MKQEEAIHYFKALSQSWRGGTEEIHARTVGCQSIFKLHVSGMRFNCNTTQPHRTVTSLLGMMLQIKQTSFFLAFFLPSILLPRHGASSCCGWRRRPPDMESSCKYIERAVADRRKRAILHMWGWSGVTTPHRKKNLVTKCNTGPRNLQALVNTVLNLPVP